MSFAELDTFLRLHDMRNNTKIARWISNHDMHGEHYSHLPEWEARNKKYAINI